MLRKTKKKKKATRMRGRGQGTHGWGARKKHKKSGHRGGKGLAGTGKRGDQKKTLIMKMYGHSYFGKQGITSRKTKRDNRKRINLKDLELGIEKYGKKTGDKWAINMPTYKILDSGKEYQLKNKLIIKAKEASKSAIDKVKKAGGEIALPQNSKTDEKKNDKKEE